MIIGKQPASVPKAKRERRWAALSAEDKSRERSKTAKRAAGDARRSALMGDHDAEAAGRILGCKLGALAARGNIEAVRSLVASVNSDIARGRRDPRQRASEEGSAAAWLGAVKCPDPALGALCMAELLRWAKPGRQALASAAESAARVEGGSQVMLFLDSLGALAGDGRTLARMERVKMAALFSSADLALANSPGPLRL